jgi:branched-chain amino acid transport system ATP-binding protein
MLAAEALNKQFGGLHAVRDLSFAVTPGTVTSIIGPNGAGKTTLFNLVSGLLPPSSGRIRFDGRDITGLPPHERTARGLSRTFQNLQVFFNMTALENVMVGRHLHCDRRLLPSLLRFRRVVRGEAACRQEAAELMRFVGLGDYLEADAAAMPYGALKRLEIARALATGPRMLLLDEPAAGLNPAETKDIDRLIQKVAETGVTVLLVEHDMRLVMGVSDHILVLDYGCKLAEGTAAEVRRDPEVIAAYLGAQGAGV